jgi:hypothetical protein
MNEKDILKLVQETFDEEITAHSAETILGSEVWIEGRDKFEQSLEEKLKKLFEDNDLSK